MSTPKPIRFSCPVCATKLAVPYDERHKAITCPDCRETVQLAGYQLFWPGLKVRCSELWASLLRSRQRMRERRLQATVAELEARQHAVKEAARIQQERNEQIAQQERERQAARALALQGSHEAKQWYCSIGGETFGPMPEERLQAWISDGKAKPDTPVRTENMATWIAGDNLNYLVVADLPEIFSWPVQPSAQEAAVRCPKCGSTQVSANKRGMDAGDACCGALALGPLGLLCGMKGSNIVVVTCLKCGNQWKVGKG